MFLVKLAVAIPFERIDKQRDHQCCCYAAQQKDSTEGVQLNRTEGFPMLSIRIYNFFVAVVGAAKAFIHHRFESFNIRRREYEESNQISENLRALCGHKENPKIQGYAGFFLLTSQISVVGTIDGKVGTLCAP